MRTLTIQIVQLVGTYILHQRLYLLLYPVAECTLREYITQPIDSRGEIWEKELKNCFGCLANSVAFLHSKQVAIKHKDIKPSNILMFRGTPILTDFGISNSFKDKEHSTSSGFTKRSPPYAAPEVISHGKRNTSQDIFSLGLVFLDMFWALKGKQHNRSDLDGGLREGAYPGVTLDQTDINFAGSMVKLAYEQSPVFQKPESLIKVIRLMVSMQRDQRPTADTIWTIFTNPTCFGQTCGDCCLPKAMRDVTTFTEWTGLQTYLPLRSRDPYDEYSHYEASSGEDTVRANFDGTFSPALSSNFDWSGQGRGFHAELGNEQEGMMASVRVLGQGSSGIVEEVKCNGKYFARKTIRLARSRREATTAIFNNEVNLMRTLRHRHILQVIGSYSTQRALSMLTFPVCHFNLSMLLVECETMRGIRGVDEFTRNIRIVLKRSIHCLAQALEYLHENQVRHVDIKPANILYRDFENVMSAHVYIADFGVSKSIADLTSTGTEGPPAFITQRYAAPEMLDHTRRGRSADIFSLGCTFYEMLICILCAHDHDIDSLYARSLPQLRMFTGDLGNHTGVAEGLRITRSQINRMANLITGMTRENPEDRPTAESIALALGANDCCYLEPEDPRESTGPVNINDEVPVS
jgi:serine/threonine protein kinase